VVPEGHNTQQRDVHYALRLNVLSLQQVVSDAPACTAGPVQTLHHHTKSISCAGSVLREQLCTLLVIQQTRSVGRDCTAFQQCLRGVKTATASASANHSVVFVLAFMPACRWIATEANNDYRMCTPPGLIYARAGEMRRHNKVLVLQVRAAAGSDDPTALWLNAYTVYANAYRCNSRSRPRVWFQRRSR
jgi:hypothetical protein